MKAEPLGVLYAVSAMAATGVVRQQHDLIPLLGSVLAGGFCTGLYSFWKSRKRAADPTDTSLWAMISIIGSMALGFFAAPDLAGEYGNGAFVIHEPLMAFIITTSGGPMIEWMLSGGSFRLVRDLWPWGAKKGTDDV